jgi:hypothetical protein
MKVGRNDPCPCGSGKKYKHCCARKPPLDAPANPEPAGLEGDVLDDYDLEDQDQEPENDMGISEVLLRMITNFRKLTLRKKPHIRAYYKIRNLHSEIVDAMIQYSEEGKFDLHTAPDARPSSGRNKNTVHLQIFTFDLKTELGVYAFYDMLIYKAAVNTTCITEVFLQSHRYRKPEKIECLQSMLDSTRGLFEIVHTDIEDAYVRLKEVFTGAEYTITDIGLSSNPDNDGIYLYTRLITYQGITFGTGLNLTFTKTDSFIRKHIQEHRANYNPEGEMERFIQLYNRYTQYPNKMRMVVNTSYK